MNNLTENDEKILFHTLGYDYQPRWNDNKGGYRNYFCTSKNCDDYDVIQKLVKDEYMEFCGNDCWSGDSEYFKVTQKGIDYVVDLWQKKKKENKPSRSKRRYQAYWDWSDCYANGTFKDFLHWLSPKEKDKILYPEEVKIVEEFKKRWNI